MGAQLLTTIDREGFGNDNYAHTLIRSNTYHGDDNFRDDGNLSFPIKKIGNPHHSTFLPILGNSSIRFDGLSYLKMAYNSIFDYDSSMNLTIDFWIKVDNNALTQVIMGQFVGQGGPGWTMYFVNPGSIYIYSAGAFISAPNFIGFNNTWYHFAWVQKVGVGSKIFKNGIKVASTNQYPVATGTTTENMSIGARDDTGAKYYLTGHLAEIRFSNIARWWNNFDPPNRAYGILKRHDGGLNCVCLITGEETMNSSSTFTEWSKSQHTVNIIGNGTYKDPNTKVLGDASWNNEGLSDYFQIISNLSDFSFATYEDFTFDMWLYIDSFQPDAASYGIFTTSVYNSAGIVLLLSGADNLFVWGASSGGPRINGWITPPKNQWLHVAVVRNGGDTIKMYQNGIQDGVTWTYSGALPCLGGQFNVLGRHVGVNRSIRAKVDNFRVVKGRALWSSNFSSDLPVRQSYYTAPLKYSGGANCVCLLTGEEYMNSSTTFTEWSPSKHTVNLIGDGLRQDSVNKKIGDYSWQSDATNDKFNITDNISDFAFGVSEDFTFDTWLWFNSVQSVAPTQSWGIFGTSSFGLPGISAFVQFGNSMYVYSNGILGINSAVVIPMDQWFHLALVRSSGTIKCYVNGAQYGNSWAYSNALTCPTELTILGREDVLSHSVKGKIDNFRIIKSSALWTADFSGNLPVNKSYYK